MQSTVVVAARVPADQAEQFQVEAARCGLTRSRALAALIGRALQPLADVTPPAGGISVCVERAFEELPGVSRR